jgi:cephalosporin hydroxylase
MELYLSVEHLRLHKQIGVTMEFKVKGQELLKKVEDLIREGNVRRIIIKDTEGKTFIEIPLSFGVIGVLAAPIVAAVGALAGVVANFSVEVIKTEEEDTAEFTEVVDKEKE